MNEAQKGRKEALCSGYAFDDETAEEMAVAVDKVKELELQIDELKLKMLDEVSAKTKARAERDALKLQIGEQARAIRNVQRALKRNENREINMGEAWALIKEAVENVQQ